MSAAVHEVDVCIAGGGPAGLVLGVLLARQGVRTLVLERNPDFAREYRGEVLMPRFTRLFRDLGLFDVIERGVHRRLEGLQVQYRDRLLARISLRDVCPDTPFALWMPQPVLLEALRAHGATHAAFDLWFDARVTALLADGAGGTGAGARGVRVERGGATVDVQARVTVGADGRFSTLRRLGAFALDYQSHDFDVVWFTLPEDVDRSGDPAAFRAFLTDARPYLALPKHPASIQCGMLVPPHGFREYAADLERMRRDLLAGPSFMHTFARELADLTPFHVLAAKIEHVERWARDGLVLIGDAAHTCSPAGAVGVSIAVETAAVAADVIGRAIEGGDASATVLDDIQARRDPEVRRVHALQRRIGRPLAARSSFGRKILAAVLPVAGHVGILARTLRRVVVLEPRLEVSDRVRTARATPRT